MSTNSNRHFVAIRNQTYERLVAKGRFGESTSDLINRLLNQLEGKKSGSVNPGEDYQNQQSVNASDRK